MKMFYKKDQCFVEVYHFFENNTALFYKEEKGWGKENIIEFVPEEYLSLNHIHMDIKEKFEEKLYENELGWVTSDGITFFEYDNALLHEIKKSL